MHARTRVKATASPDPLAPGREVQLKLQGFGFQATADEAGTARAKQLQEATGTVMGVGEVLHLFSVPITVVRPP